MTTPNARFIARAHVNNEKIDMINHWVVLQATAPGTCQITVNKNIKQFAQISVDLGWGNSIDRVFNGYVERVMPAENGWYTLFCREISATLKFNYSIMLRHPTMQKVLDELKAQSGVEFVIPDAAYTKSSIPCFYYDGSGYGILENIGRAFQIEDFMWQQQGNGKVFIGSYTDSFWYDKPVTIPNNLMTDHQGGKQATMAAATMVRPNVTANGERIQQIEFKETKMTISW